jgi:3-phytase
MKYTNILPGLIAAFICSLPVAAQVQAKIAVASPLKPAIVTDTVKYDTDDPAIWINPADVAQSLVVGTDKDSDGGLYVFNLQGKIVNKVTGLKRPNNVDIAYGLKLDGKPTDIAVATERETGTIRIFSMPDLRPLDNGGIRVFEGSPDRLPMGIALYTRPSDGAMFAIVGRKTGPSGSYLWAYRLGDDGKGSVSATLVNKFGKYSGKKEIESIAVDNELGVLYYSDEQYGIHKYEADPEQGNKELALFGQQDFKEDIEGISIYKHGDGSGYVLVSDQQANKFVVYTREGIARPNTRIASIPVSTIESDGSDVTQIALNAQFPEGVFIAMSNGKVFHFYDWRLIQERINAAQQ